VRAREVYTALDSIGSFDCGHPLLNTIHRAARQTFLYSYHSFPMDCPWYERTGWGGDANCTAEMALHNFDMIHANRKWMQDYEDNMAPNGNVYFIVPQGMPGRVALEEKHRNHSPWWMLPPVFIPYWQYQMTADLRLLEEFYPIMKRRMNHEVEINLVDNLASSHWGDWVAPFSQLLPKARETQATAIVFHALKCMEEVALLLGHSEDARAWAMRAEEVNRAYNDKYYDAEKKLYWRPGETAYCQTSNLLPLAYGMVPPEDLAAVQKNLGVHINRIQTGVVGAKYLLPVLTESGHLEKAWQLATTTDYPSWGHWFTDASHSLVTQTLLESWNPDPRSLAHPYFGSVDEWYFKYLAGITPAQPGFRETQIKPHLPAALDRAHGEIQTVHGLVKSSWQREGDSLILNVVIPVNTSATVYVPAANPAQVMESGVPAEQAPGVAYLSTQEGYVRYQVGSGSYSLVIEKIVTTQGSE
jgi:alpha-L-rhamnosidase